MNKIWITEFQLYMHEPDRVKQKEVENDITFGLLL